MKLSQVEELLKLMKTYGADFVKVEDQDASISIRMTPVQRQGMLQKLPEQTSGDGDSVASKDGEALKPAKENTSSETAVVCPTVGIFYSAPGPEEPPFVRVGDHVEKATILCIIEAMKVMNEIPAGIAGTITDILPVNGDRVEYEQPLVMIRADL